MSGFCDIEGDEDADWYWPDGSTEKQIVATVRVQCCECNGPIEIGESCWENRGFLADHKISDGFDDWWYTLHWSQAAKILKKSIAVTYYAVKFDDFDWADEWYFELEDYYNENMVRQLEDDIGVEDYYQHETCRRIARWMNLGVIGSCDIPYGYVRECLEEWIEAMQDPNNADFETIELRKHSKRIAVLPELLKRYGKRA
jgi:hypothetical protein